MESAAALTLGAAVRRFLARQLPHSPTSAEVQQFSDFAMSGSPGYSVFSYFSDVSCPIFDVSALRLGFVLCCAALLSLKAETQVHP